MRRVDLLYRMLRNDLESLHKHTVLLWRDLQCFLLGSWPVESPVIKSFVKKEKSIPFPKEPFDAVISSPAKKIKSIFVIRVEMKLEADDV